MYSVVPAEIDRVKIYKWRLRLYFRKLVTLLEALSDIITMIKTCSSTFTEYNSDSINALLTRSCSRLRHIWWPATLSQLLIFCGVYLSKDTHDGMKIVAPESPKTSKLGLKLVR